jgi:hypothetical protein
VGHPGQVAKKGLGLGGHGRGAEVQLRPEDVDRLGVLLEGHLEAWEGEKGPGGLLGEEAHPVALGKKPSHLPLPLAVRAKASGLVL